MKNKSIDGRTLTIAGKSFERGFGSHSESLLTILLDGKATRFTARVGIDDEVKGQRPAAEFVINGDGKKLWASGIMHLGDTARLCSVRLEGIKKLELVVTDGGNGNYYDHGSNYFFVDFDYGVKDVKGATSAYWEISRGIKFWKAPFEIHVEYDGGLGQYVSTPTNGAYTINDACNCNLARFY